MSEPILKSSDEDERGKKAQAEPKEKSDEVLDLAKNTRSKALEIDSKALKEAERHGLEPEQWLDLVHMAKAMGLPGPEQWIDHYYTFNQDGSIRINDSLKIFEKEVKNDQADGALDKPKTPRPPLLERLPKNLKVKGVFYLLNCKKIPHLPAGLNVSDDLWLSGSAIEEIPKDLELGRALVANKCPNLKTVQKTSFNGNVSLMDCPQLNSLPEGFTASGMVRLDRSPIKTLPQKINVGHLSLLGCNSLEGLPDDLTVKGELILSENGNKEVEKQAERLKADKNIGSIRYH